MRGLECFFLINCQLLESSHAPEANIKSLYLEDQSFAKYFSIVLLEGLMDTLEPVTHILL